jgi:hypothetical protein
MKMTYRVALVVLALGITGVAAQGQSGVVGELSKGLSNPSAGPTPEPKAAQEASAPVVDNGAMPGDSHVRIVRLSDAKGQLALDRKTGNGFEQTMPNMPIVQGEKLRTADGYAEVEFEDNSTMRLAPNSQVDFPLLVLRSSGAKASTMKVALGTVYVSTESTKGNEFQLLTGDAKLMVAPSTHLRLEVNESRTVVSVFNGSVEVQRGTETTLVDKKQSLTLSGDKVTVAKKIEGEPFDQWDKESIDYHQRYSAANTFAGGGNAYGLSDLNYYGNFINGGAFGSFWQPYLVGEGWSPYGNGVWALYPGAGYSWVSPYPWGWLPYHSGAWSFFPGYGWGWQPGGAWNGLNNTARVGTVAAGAGMAGSSTLTQGGVHAPLRTATAPPAPVASATTRASLVMSNDKPVVFSKEDRPGNFVFQKNSAGLGVPRGSLGNLNKISNEVGRHGSANMEVFATAPSRETAGSVHAATRGPETLHRGSPADGAQGWHGNEGLSSASRQGSASQGGQAQPSFHSSGASPSSGSGGSMGAANSGGGSSGNGGARGSAASPK